MAHATRNVDIEKEEIMKVEIEKALFSSWERVLFNSFQIHKKRTGNKSYSDYAKVLSDSQFRPMFNDFIGAETLFLNEKQKIASFYKKILELFNQDFYPLNSVGILKGSRHSKIIDIKIGAGDFHHGQSTSILELEGGHHLIYKPTDGSIAVAFRDLIDWVNQFYFLSKDRHEILNQGNYHWAEFIVNAPCENNEDIKRYYERSGFLLCLVYLLNGTDFHAENIIADASQPVLIDLETVVQPRISDATSRYFKSIENTEDDTVLKSLMLPLPEQEMNNLPRGYCGFGYYKEPSITNLEKVSINAFTDNWKIVTRFNEINLIRDNLPRLGDKPIHLIEDNLIFFVNGFKKCYQLILDQRKWLLKSSTSPLKSFSNIEVRLVWRATNIYSRIFSKLKLPENLKDKGTFEYKLKNYLSVAYKNVPQDSDLWLIYRSELKQMLNGDIPIFQFNTSSRDLKTEFGTVKNIFDLSAIENVERKLKKFSLEDLKYQEKLIVESFK